MIIKRIGITQLQSDALTLRLVREIHAETDAPQGKLYHQAQNTAACARQAVAYRESESQFDLTVVPLLRYYSLLNTLKALLYLFDLTFPQSTTVLQHGVSVRRSKRSAYQWTWESVMLHKDGIAQAFNALCTPEQELPARLIMGDLLGQFPQMHASIHLFDKHFLHAYPLHPESAETCLISREIASNQGLTVDEWKRAYLGAGPVGRGSVGAASEGAATLGAVRLDAAADVGRSGAGSQAAEEPEPRGLMRIGQPEPNHPWYGSYEGVAYLHDQQNIPIWLAHYGLLYTLSALCRYSPAEWSDIVLWQSEPDALLVREYFKLPPLQLYLEEGPKLGASAVDSLWRSQRVKDMVGEVAGTRVR